MLLKEFYQNKRVLITGAAGTIGRELVKFVLSYQPQELRLMDNNETEMFFLMEAYKPHGALCFLGDVRDRDKLEKLARDIDIIIHTAAFKHVILSEHNPFDAVQTNILGVQNIIKAAVNGGVKYVLFTSSDKAVNPTNVMGTSKLMGERLITAANAFHFSGGTIFSSTRFGNVLGSRGSVVPLFLKQIRQGGPVTLTDRRMTRFVMTIAEAARLVLQSLVLACGGEVFVTKMPVVSIPDLAEVMVELLAPQYGYDPQDIEIREVGAKPGEKLYEELMSDEERHRSLELAEMFVITPAFKGVYDNIRYQYPGIVREAVDRPYISSQEPALDKNALKQYFLDHRVLETVEL